MAKRTIKKPAVAKKSVSFPADLLEEGLKRAIARRRNFSGYLQELVAEDLEKQTKAA